MLKKFLTSTSTLLLLSAPFLSMPCHASTKHVPAGSTWTITAADSQTTLESLTLGDGATIRFANDVKYWDLKVKSAEIGRDVTINAQGAAGAVGKVGSSAAGTASGCEKGSAGGNGEDGARGNNGVHLDLQLGLSSIGSLTVLTDGGTGGTGGAGGTGQDASDARNCLATRGGAGGVGGTGGQAGDAGNINLVYWNASGRDIGNVNHRITVSSEGGKVGKGGAGGAGGKGSPGHYINQRSLSGNQTWQEGGKTGSVGASGAEGGAGKTGRSMVTERTGNAPAAIVINNSQDKAQSAEIDLLKQQLELMQKRLESIEKR